MVLSSAGNEPDCQGWSSFSWTEPSSISSVNVSEKKLRIRTCPTAQQSDGFSVRSCEVLSSGPLHWRDPYSTTTIEHWGTLGISFCYRLDNGSLNSTYSDKAKQCFSKSHVAVIPNNSCCWSHKSRRLHLSCCWKPTAASLLPHGLTADAASRCTPQLRRCLSQINASVKENSVFQNSFNCASEETPSNFQLEVIHLQHDMLKGNCQESSWVNAFRVMNTLDQNHGLISIWQSLCVKGIFRDEMHKI